MKFCLPKLINDAIQSSAGASSKEMNIHEYTSKITLACQRWRRVFFFSLMSYFVVAVVALKRMNSCGLIGRQAKEVEKIYL